MTELFLENLIIKVSDILLIVVGKLTYSEQLLINKIKVESKKQNKGKIFIIHNLQEFRTKEQVENYIKNTLLKCSTFDLNKRTWISIEKDKEEKEEDKNEKPKKEEIGEDKKEGPKKEENMKEQQDKEEIEQSKEKNEKINNSDYNQINQDIQRDDSEISTDNNQTDNYKINPEQKDKNEINQKPNILNESNKKNDEENEKKGIEDAKEKDNIDDENVEEESKLNNVHFTEILNYGDKKLEIYHLIIANEDSEAGIIYNQYAFNFISNVYNLISEPKKFDVFDQVKDNFKKLSKIILNNNEIKEFKFTENETILQDKVKFIKLEYDKELNLKKCYTDELGFSLFKTGNFEPKYNYFKPDENTLEIRLEVPGNVKLEVNHEVIGDETIITVTGTKKKDNQPKEPNYNLDNIREFSEFELNIPLKVEDFKIKESKPKEGYPKFVQGVCLIRYELSQKGEKAEQSVEDKEL